MVGRIENRVWAHRRARGAERRSERGAKRRTEAGAEARGHGVLPEGIFKIPERAMGIWIKSPIKNPNFVHIFFHLYLISKPFWCCCYHIYFVPLKEPTTSTTNRYMLRNSLSYENLDLFVCVPSDFRWKYLQSAIKNILIFLYIYYTQILTGMRSAEIRHQGSEIFIDALTNSVIFHSKNLYNVNVLGRETLKNDFKVRNLLEYILKNSKSWF